jgi:hypothetical protein
VYRCSEEKEFPFEIVDIIFKDTFLYIFSLHENEYKILLKADKKEGRKKRTE